MLRSPPIDLHRTSRKIGTHPTIKKLSRRSKNTSCLHPCCELRRPRTRSRCILPHKNRLLELFYYKKKMARSQRLLDAETWYIFVKKLCLSLYYACSKFRHYILSSSCIVACQYDVIKHILLKPILSGMIGKWPYALIEYDLAYEPLRSMKGQVVVDHSVDFVQLKPWELYFDGSVCSKGQGAECVIISPSGVYIDLSIRLEFACTNNQVEYESLLHGLEYLRDLGARDVDVFGDSNLIVQVD
jgi:hypothetical protein